MPTHDARTNQAAHDAPTDQPAHDAAHRTQPRREERPAEGNPAGNYPAEGNSVVGYQRPDDRPAVAGAAPGDGSGAGGSLAAAINLTIPLATLLGLAERPGEAAGLGAIDPALARELARRAVGNPRTTWCVTVTDHEGHATGHGCARTTRRTGRRSGPGPNKPGPGSTPGPGKHQSQQARAKQQSQGQEARQGQTDRASSRSPATRDMGHPADTAGGGYIPAVIATFSSTLSRSRSLTATTGMNQLATSPATPSATWSRSATQNAPGRRAAGRRGDATSNMRFPGIRAGGHVAVTAGPAVVIITTRNKLTAGNLSKTSPGTTRGPHRPAGATPPDPRNTRSETEPGPLKSFVTPLSFRRGGRPAHEQGRAGSRFVGCAAPPLGLSTTRCRVLAENMSSSSQRTCRRPRRETSSSS